jgi:hypothetical protein
MLYLTAAGACAVLGTRSAANALAEVPRGRDSPADPLPVTGTSGQAGQ